MITLAEGCLIFHLSNGESVPFSAEMISVEMSGETSRWFDPELAAEAARAVFHYFKNELGRQSVSAEEFAAAMEKVLSGFHLRNIVVQQGIDRKPVIESDLSRLARETGDAGELLFFPRLRTELQEHLKQGPRVLRFRGLRQCVKEMTASRRWTPRCGELQEKIVSFLRGCAQAQTGAPDFALVVD